MHSPMVARIDSEHCDRSPFCPASRACPANAIGSLNGTSDIRGLRAALAVDPEKCTGCGRCVGYCPHQAIALVPRRGTSEQQLAASSEGAI